MNIEETVLEKLKGLPSEMKQEVLRFVESLHEKRGYKSSRRSLKGLWSDLQVDISEDDIAEIRREMWGRFPRENI